MLSHLRVMSCYCSANKISNCKKINKNKIVTSIKVIIFCLVYHLTMEGERTRPLVHSPESLISTMGEDHFFTFLDVRSKKIQQNAIFWLIFIPIIINVLFFIVIGFVCSFERPGIISCHLSIILVPKNTSLILGIGVLFKTQEV